MTMTELKRAAPGAVAIAGVIGAIVFFVWTSTLERDQTEERFRRLASNLLLTVDIGVQESSHAIESVGAFLDASETINRDQFKTIVQPLFSRELGLQALEWIPRISRSQRPASESSAAEALGFGFRITELDSAGITIPAKDRAEYFPVYFVEPLSGNEAALGFDLASNPPRASALQRARDSGTLTATDRITLVQETGQQYGYLLFLPIYEGGAVADLLEDRRRLLRGFILGVFRVGDQIQALLPEEGGDVDVYAFDVSDPGEPSLLYAPPGVPVSSAVGPGSTVLNEGLTRKLAVGDHTWQIVATHSATSWTTNIWLSWVAATGLLAFSLLLAYYLAGLQRRAIRVEELVKERTLLLSTAEARIRAVLETAVEGIITIDGSGIIESANPAAEALFGYEEQEIIGQNINVLMPSPYREKHDGYLRSYHATGVAKIIGTIRELTGLRKGGKTFPLELAVSEWDAGNQQMFTGIVRDITDRKLEEDRILETAELKSHLVSVVSHELRTPLTAIAEGVNLVLDGKAGETLEEQHGILAISKRNIDRLSRLINSFLDFQRLEAGALPLRIRPANPNVLVRETIDNFGRSAAVAGFRITSVLLERIDEVDCDADLILQVLANLVGNAIKYGPGGEIRLTTDQTASEVRIGVHDEGRGIPEKDKDKLFRPFGRLSSEGAGSPIQGTGLGLSISRRIVEKHGGKLVVDPSGEIGTCFSFTLPFKVSDHRAWESKESTRGG